MSKGKGDNEVQETILIRRVNHGDHDTPHGGAWKIAYADFVTAMMTFFLVMWLINSANEVTKKQVASYFNPIKLSDNASGDRGLGSKVPTNKDAKDNKDESTAIKLPGTLKPMGDREAAASQQTAPSPEDKMLTDPYRALDEIARDRAGKGTARSPDLLGNGAGDPFDPQSWEALKEAQRRDFPTGMTGQGKSQVDGTADAKPMALAPEGAIRPGVDGKRESAEQLVARAKDILNEIKTLAHNDGLAMDLNMTVEPVPEGVRISLTDGSNAAMFALGSARPSPALIALLETVAKVLTQHDGALVIAGHTDAKQYRNRHYDNWQLSTARAHMASYILFRGGLEQTRVMRVEGHADRDLKVPDKPEDGANRRVDIVLMSAEK